MMVAKEEPYALQGRKKPDFPLTTKDKLTQKLPAVFLFYWHNSPLLLNQLLALSVGPPLDSSPGWHRAVEWLLEPNQSVCFGNALLL